MEYKHLQKFIDRLKLRGYKEDCPTKDWETGISYWHYFKRPWAITIKLADWGFAVKTHRVDKEYDYNGRIIK